MTELVIPSHTEIRVGRVILYHQQGHPARIDVSGDRITIVDAGVWTISPVLGSGVTRHFGKHDTHDIVDTGNGA